MDYHLLRSWLGLPPGAWPPDHYTLLGFGAGVADAEAIEPRVLRQMDLLRQHQLRHPELVTEGMNRLAQALITLTDPAGKTAYDAELGLAASTKLPSPKFTRAVEPPPSRSAPLIVAEPVLDDSPFDDEAFEIPDATDATQEIFVPAKEAAGYPLAESGPLPPRPVPALEPPRRTVPVAKVVAEPAPIELVVAAPPPSTARRWIYTRLAQLRAARRAWERLGAILGDPQDPIDRPGRLLLLLEAAAAVRPHLPALAEVMAGAERPGAIVVAILNQPLMLDTLRRLLPDQRQALAIDWRRGQDELLDAYLRLRRQARESRDTGERGQRLPTALRWLLDYPELALIGLALFALLIAFAHSR